MCHWNTVVMVDDNGTLYAYVDIPIKKQTFPAAIVTYNINNVYTVFLINFMLFYWTKTVLFFQTRKLR